MNRTQIRSSLILLLTAAIWGASFVAQSSGMSYIGPFTFNGIRLIFGALSLVPLILILEKRAGKSIDLKSLFPRRTFFAGVCCGVVMCFASNLQQYGIQYTTVGKAAFITTFYIVMVPVLGIFIGRKSGITIWIAVVVAFFGLYFLSITDGLGSVTLGDVLLFLCALMYAVHILVIDHFSKTCEVLKMSFLQLLVAGVITCAIMMIVEKPDFSMVLLAWKELAYSAFISCGVANTLQMVGQKGLHPALASLIMSLESALSLLSGWVLLNEMLTKRELIGCALMFVAVLISQIPTREGEIE